MPEYSPEWALRRLRARAAAGVGRLHVTGLSRLALWPIAVAVGVVTGYAVLGFMQAITHLERWIYGADFRSVHSRAAALDWWYLILVPVVGGLIIGQILRLAPGRRGRGVDEVIQAVALKSGRVDRRQGVASALAAVVTLSAGGSAGREGPAVHIGAVIASWISERIGARGATARDILGCAAAAAVSASFNAPLAGALFALEVVLRHYALRAFGPIVVASVAAAVVSRIHLGDLPQFAMPAHSVGFYWEMPAFALLGVVCGLVGVAMIRTIFVAEQIGDRVQALLRLPDSLRPAVAGLLLGAIAIGFPHIIGVGYETSFAVLRGSGFDFVTAVVFAVAKVVAVAVTFAGRMVGGIFSPAVMIGALTGAAFGDLALTIYPHLTGVASLYALAGMGAVAGAVLGAPISSTLIVFELTGDYQAAIAVVIAVSLASVVSDRLVARSFFLTQLERQGLKLAGGPQAYLAATVTVRDLMRPRGADNGAPDAGCRELVDQGAALTPGDTLERALRMFDRLRGPYLPVLDRGEPVAASGGREAPELLGAVFHVDALKAYNRVLEEEMREEHA
jgi:chloride channel protein, CIC family